MLRSFSENKTATIIIIIITTRTIKIKIKIIMTMVRNNKRNERLQFLNKQWTSHHNPVIQFLQ